MNPLTYEDLESSISEFLKDCKSIRAERQKDYGFHFLDNYNKYGLKGFLINDGEITARLEQMEKGGTDYKDLEKSLRNALCDGINYRLLLLFWLERERWRNPIDEYWSAFFWPRPTVEEVVSNIETDVESVLSSLDFNGIPVGQHMSVSSNLSIIYLGDKIKWRYETNLTTEEGHLNSVSGIMEIPPNTIRGFP